MWHFRGERVQPMRLTVIGQLAGLISGAYFADFGDEVECVDLDDRRIDALKGSEMPKRHLLFCTWDGVVILVAALAPGTLSGGLI